MAAADEEEEAGEEGAAEGRVSHPEDGMGMDEEPDWHVALEDGTLATLPLDREGSTYMLDNDGVTVKELWESLDLTQLREVSPRSLPTGTHSYPAASCRLHTRATRNLCRPSASRASLSPGIIGLVTPCMPALAWTHFTAAKRSFQPW